ncbi:MAG: protein kinase [Myxococcales bacterium]
MRFVGAVAIADYLSRPNREPAVDALLCDRPRPTVGGWVELARAASASVVHDRASAAVPELAAIFHKESGALVGTVAGMEAAEAQLRPAESADAARAARRAVNTLPAERNRVHEAMGLSDEEARSRFRALWEPITALLEGLSFFADYRLLAVDEVVAETRQTRLFVRDYTGSAERKPPLRCSASAPPPVRVPFLLGPDHKRALVLDPLVVLAHDSGSDGWLPLLPYDLSRPRPLYWKPRGAARTVERPWPDLGGEDEQGKRLRSWSDVVESGAELLTRVELGSLGASLASAHRQEQGGLLGQEIAGFRVSDLVGRGGMASVYSAERTDESGQVERRALKVLAPDLIGDATLVQRMVVEGRRHEQLRHPHVLACHGSGLLEDGRPYLLLDFVPRSLAALISAEGPLAPADARRIALQINEGLRFLHQRGIVHRDLKPSNVLVDDTGKALLSDLGIARGGGDETMTRTAQGPLGVWAYLAPEVRNGGRATEASDLYALGVTWAEMLGAALPIDASVARKNILEPGHDAPSWEAITTLLSIDPTRRLSAFAPPPLGVDAPYRGLAAYREEDHAIYFGREADIDRVLEKLHGSAVVALDATSGAGKSSLAHAGVAPAVRAGALGEVGAWDVISLTPGRAPLRSLEAALTPLREAGEASAEAPFELLSRRAANGRGTLLIVDALEEVCTQGATPEEQAGFGSTLARFSGGKIPGVRLLIAYRSDLRDRIARIPTLAPLLRSADAVLIGPLGREGVHAVLRRPAARWGFSFEHESIVEEAVEAVGDEVGALPLLSFALAELWARRDQERRRLPLKAWREDLAGVTGALARHADRAIAELTPEERSTAREILTRLVNDDGTRRRRELGDLLRSLEAPESGTRVVDRLTERRLLARTERGEIVLAHEALARNWPLLRGWREQDADDVAFHERLQEAARVWDSGSGKTEDLWAGAKLAALAEWRRGRELSELERRFADASERAARRTRRLRQGLTLAVVAVLALLAVVAQRARVAAERREQEARENLAQLYVDRAHEALRANEPDRAWVLLATSLTLHDKPEVRDEVGQLRANRPTRFKLAWRASASPVGGQVACSPKGRSVAVASPDDGLVLFDAGTGSKRYQVRAGGEAVVALPWSPDESWLAVVGESEVLLVKAEDGTVASRVPLQCPTAATFLAAADGVQLVVGDCAGTVRRLRVPGASPDGAPIRLENAVRSLWPGGEGRGLADLGGGTSKVLFAKDPTEHLVPEAAESPKTLAVFAYQNDAFWLTDGAVHSDASFWPKGVDPSDESAGEPLRAGSQGALVPLDEPPAPKAWSFAAAGRLAVASASGKVLVLALAGPGAGKAETLEGSSPQAISLSDEGTHLAVLGADGTVTAWSTAQLLGRRVGFGKGPRIEVSAAGDRVGLVSADEIKVIDDGGRWQELRGASLGGKFAEAAGQLTDEPVADDAGFPDGEMAAALSRDFGTAAWMTNSNAVAVIRLATPEAPRIFPTPDLMLQPKSIALSGDGRYLAFAQREGESVRILDTSLEAPPPSQLGFPEEIADLAWSADGNVLARAGRTDNVIELIGANRILAAGESRVLTVSLSGDARTLVSGHQDGSVQVWDTGAKRVSRRFASGFPEVQRIAFSTDGKRLAATDGSSVGLWSEGGQEFAKRTFEGGVRSLAISEKGTISVVDGRGAVHLWREGEAAPRRQPAVEGAWSAALSDADGTLVVGTAAGELVVYEADSGRQRRRVGVGKGAVHDLRLLDGGRAATATDERLALVDLAGGTLVVQHENFWQESRIRRFAISPKGLGAAAAYRWPDGSDGYIEFSDFKTGEKQVQVRRGLFLWDEGPTPVAFTPDGTSLLVGSKRGLRILHPTTGAERAVLATRGGTMARLVASSSGRWVAVAFKGGAFEVWGLSGERRPGFATSAEEVVDLAFSTDDRQLAAVSKDGSSVPVVDGVRCAGRALLVRLRPFALRRLPVGEGSGGGPPQRRDPSARPRAAPSRQDGAGRRPPGRSGPGDGPRGPRPRGAPDGPQAACPPRLQVDESLPGGRRRAPAGLRPGDAGQRRRRAVCRAPSAGEEPGTARCSSRARGRRGGRAVRAGGGRRGALGVGAARRNHRTGTEPRVRRANSCCPSHRPGRRRPYGGRRGRGRGRDGRRLRRARGGSNDRAGPAQGRGDWLRWPREEPRHRRRFRRGARARRRFRHAGRVVRRRWAHERRGALAGWFEGPRRTRRRGSDGVRALRREGVRSRSHDPPRRRAGRRVVGRRRDTLERWRRRGRLLVGRCGAVLRDAPAWGGRPGSPVRSKGGDARHRRPRGSGVSLAGSDGETDPPRRDGAGRSQRLLFGRRKDGLVCTCARCRVGLVHFWRHTDGDAGPARDHLEGGRSRSRTRPHRLRIERGRGGVDGWLATFLVERRERGRERRRPRSAARLVEESIPIPVPQLAEPRASPVTVRTRCWRGLAEPRCWTSPRSPSTKSLWASERSEWPSAPMGSSPLPRVPTAGWLSPRWTRSTSNTSG